MLVETGRRTGGGPAPATGSFVGACRYVLLADAFQFCLRNGLVPATRTIVAVGAGALSLALLAVGPIGFVAGALLQQAGAVLGVGAGALTGLLLAVMVLRGVLAAVRATARRTRLAVFGPADLPALRAFDIPLDAVLVARVLRPTLISQLLSTLTAVGAATALAFGSGTAPSGATLVTLLVSGAFGLVVPVLLAGRPIAERRSGRRSVRLVGLGAALSCGWLVGLVASAVAKVAEGYGTQELGRRADVLGEQARDMAPWGALGLALAAVGVFVVARRWRAPGRWQPATVTPGAAGSGPVRRIGGRARPSLIPTIALLRAQQGSAVVVRRAFQLTLLAGLVLTGAGVAATGLFAGSTAETTNRLVGGGALLTVAVGGSALVSTVAGAGVHLRQLRLALGAGRLRVADRHRVRRGPARADRGAARSDVRGPRAAV
jgi:hypothetical protein